MNCKWKVWLKLGVICVYILVKFDNDDFSTILPELCPFLYFKFAKFLVYRWYRAKSQMCGMPFRHFWLKLLQNNFNIWPYKVTLASWDLFPTTFYFISIVHGGFFFFLITDRQLLDMSLHSDTLSWLQANQSFLLLLGGGTAITNNLIWPDQCWNTLSTAF
jgi:hypothetical protein